MEQQKAQKKIIIIGGGLSGLSAGIFGQKNGFLTEIFEKNPVPGGLCRTWVRDGNLIDGCIHWLTGTKKDGSLRRLWDELGAFEDKDVIRENSIGTYDYNGTKITIWFDLEKLRNELLKISPEDKKVINKLIKAIKNVMKIRVPVELPVSLMGIPEFLGVACNVAPRVFWYLYLTKTQMSTFVKKFKSPALRFAVGNIIYGDINMYSVLYAFGTNAYGNGGVIRGGSTVFFDNIVRKYKELNGQIHVNKPVSKIIIENGKAVGVELQNGEKHYADYVISAADPYITKTFLPDKYKMPAYEKRANNKKFTAPSAVLVSLQIDKEAKDALGLDVMHGFNTEEFKVGYQTCGTIKIHDYSYDETFVKNGNTVCSVLLQQYIEDFEYWDSFKTKEDYNSAKQELGEKIKNLIIEKYPSLDGKIKVIDVCTPKTFNKYTGAYKGAYQSFAFTSKTGMLTHNGKVKGIKNLFLATQWTLTPGGLPPAMLTGKYSIQRILKREGMNYKITKKGGTL